MHAHAHEARGHHDCGCASARHGGGPRVHTLAWSGEESGGLGAAFGVRRPLRFLAWRLKLDERQVGELAAILNELKTERAQAAVDDRRALSALADAASGATFDDPKAQEAAKLRVTSAETLQATVAKALGRIHALLDEEQRGRLATMIRTGSLVI